VVAVIDGVIVGSGKMGLTDRAAGLMRRRHRSWSIRLARARAWAARSESTSSVGAARWVLRHPVQWGRRFQRPGRAPVAVTRVPDHRHAPASFYHPEHGLVGQLGRLGPAPRSHPELNVD